MFAPAWSVRTSACGRGAHPLPGTPAHGGLRPVEGPELPARPPKAALRVSSTRLRSRPHDGPNEVSTHCAPPARSGTGSGGIGGADLPPRPVASPRRAGPAPGAFLSGRTRGSAAATGAEPFNPLLPPPFEPGQAGLAPWTQGPGGRPGGPDRFHVALLGALVLHLVVILGVSFEPLHRSVPFTRTLDVVLVHQSTPSEVEDPELLAQASHEGGGEAPTPARPATPSPAPLVSRKAELVARVPPPPPPPPPRAAVPTREPPPAHEVPDPAPAPRLIARKTPLAELRFSEPPPRPVPRPELPAPSARETPPAPHAPRVDAVALLTTSVRYASIAAVADEKLSALSSRPRRKWVSARTRESRYAAYMDAWRRKVERIGNLNYPDEARRRRLSGSLLLDVAIDPDGRVRRIVLKRSSGHRVLDDAARRIVRLAAPFAPFPPSIREETDILHIVRTWRFSASNRFSSP